MWMFLWTSTALVCLHLDSSKTLLQRFCGGSPALNPERAEKGQTEQHPAHELENQSDRRFAPQQHRSGANSEQQRTTGSNNEDVGEGLGGSIRRDAEDVSARSQPQIVRVLPYCFKPPSPRPAVPPPARRAVRVSGKCYRSRPRCPAWPLDNAGVLNPGYRSPHEAPSS